MNEEKIRSLLESFIKSLNESGLNGVEVMQLCANLFTNAAMVTQQPDEALDDYIQTVKQKVKEHGKVLGDQRISSQS